MKRRLFLLAGLCILSIGLVGCGPPQDVVNTEAVESMEKQELILAGIDFNASILSEVDDFNQLSDDTVITLRDYGDGSGVASNNIINSVFKDAISGEMADIYIISPSFGMPIDALIVQNMFVDLYPFLNEDTTISRDDFFSTILETVQQDDKLLYFPVSYSLSGIWARPEYADNANRFPVHRISELSQMYPENNMLFGGLSNMDLIHMELAQNQDLYVNWETKECNFISERFWDVLEAAYHLPKYSPDGREEMIDYFAGVYLLEGRQFFVPYNISGFESYLMKTEDAVYNAYDGDLVSMTLTDSEVVLDIRSSFAITSACPNPDIAWNFLRTLLEMEYQQALPKASAPALPMNIHAFSVETDRLLNENKGTKVSFGRIQDLIQSANAVSSFDDQIVLIIYEEVSAYFSDEKTVEDTAQMIQDRVSLYLLEYE
jgi:multiple sugar transport system substrate-binding protein